MGYKKQWFIWFWKGDGNQMFFHPAHLMTVFHYLLSIGIDLFNLIESGQAIDASILNQKQ